MVRRTSRDVLGVGAAVALRVLEVILFGFSNEAGRFMTNSQLTIPFDESGLVTDSCPEDRSLGEPGTGARNCATLESQRMGLLASPDSGPARGPGLEEWIASNLDLDAELVHTPRNVWNRIVAGLPGLKRAPKKRAANAAVESRNEGWPRFHVGYRRGITLVRLRDAALLKEPLIQELANDLLDLIEAGNHRVVLNFGRVERLASLVVVAVQEAADRSRTGDGGALKVCGLAENLSAIFAIAAKARVEFHPDETSAIDSPWPEASGPRPLPVDVLTALLTAADPPPLCGGAPVEVRMTFESQGSTPDEIPINRTDRTAPAELWLSISAGAARGRRIAVTGEQFVIGRDRSCNLRLGSPMVSKLHAALLRREGRVFLRDLGSTNGTILNGRPIRNGEVEVQTGDRIQIGPIVATVLTGPEVREAEPVEDQVIGWLRPEGDEHGTEQIGWDDTLTIPTRDAEDPTSDGDYEIKCEVIQNVLIVTPKTSALDDDDTVEKLRVHLRALYDSPTPREVVVNLEYAGQLSAAAIGVLLAHHLRLDHAGGAMRICQAKARVMAVLHQVRLTMLVECYPTLDEAVLAAWPASAKMK
jgi:anti-anti-sigma factor